MTEFISIFIGYKIAYGVTVEMLLVDYINLLRLGIYVVVEQH